MERERMSVSHAAGEYVSNATMREVAQRILGARTIAVTSHVKVDGDALGSMLALERALAAKGKRVDLFVMGPLEPNLASVAEHSKLRRVENAPPKDDYDLIIVVDTGAWAQLEPLEAWLRARRDRIIGIDHHARGDDMAAMRLIDMTCASTTQLVLPLLDEMGCEVTGGVGGVAEALFLGLATDTGWFRYANADADVFTAAARLLRHGVDKSRLYQIVEETHRPERLALEGRALASLEYLHGGAVAMMSLSLEDFQETGGRAEEMTGIVNMPLLVGTVRVSVLLSQSEPGLTKVSFRSKPPLPGSAKDDFWNVNDIAHQFGGGGHVHAAGAKLNMDLAQARKAVRKAFET